MEYFHYIPSYSYYVICIIIQIMSYPSYDFKVASYFLKEVIYILKKIFFDENVLLLRLVIFFFLLTVYKKYFPELFLIITFSGVGES